MTMDLTFYSYLLKIRKIWFFQYWNVLLSYNFHKILFEVDIFFIVLDESCFSPKKNTFLMYWDIASRWAIVFCGFTILTFHYMLRLWYFGYFAASILYFEALISCCVTRPSEGSVLLRLVCSGAIWTWCHSAILLQCHIATLPYCHSALLLMLTTPMPCYSG